MLKLIIGMAIDGYGYDPSAPKSALTGEMGAGMELCSAKKSVKS